MPSYGDWFASIAGFQPHGWQRALGEAEACADRMLRIPTGFGKTAGVVLPWLFHRVIRGDLGWPTRLVFCLPMRVLVEQTAAAIQAWIERAGGGADAHVLMGGVEADRWELRPERPAVLVGTQDMLLSRAVNRGYGEGRARWPMTFGLVSQDALWVLDEVQLMDVGLATSAQLAAFREDDRARRARVRPAFTWWMSATLQPAWLETVDMREAARALGEGAVRIPEQERRGGLWEVNKRIEVADAGSEAELARMISGRHAAGTLTLVVVNQVQRAVAVMQAIEDACHEKRGRARVRRAGAPEVRLVHSRFRGAERAGWAAAFLSRGACQAEALPAAGRIVVATQVVEAGVDVSARLLVTDLAPWSSLVQRFGRCARYEGESGEIVVLGKSKSALPYEEADLEAAAAAVMRLAGERGDASPRSLDAFEAGCDEASLRRLYRYSPVHVIRRRDVDDLFDTTPDLSGGDIDVSRYIRSGDERDARVFWRAIAPRERSFARDEIGAVRREELCPVPVGELSDFARADRQGRPLFTLDYVRGEWVRVKDADRITPGMTVLLPSSAGGYSAALGWSPKWTEAVPPVPGEAGGGAGERLDRSAEALEDDSLSRIEAWKSIAVHGREAAEVAGGIARALGIEGRAARALDIAARWHDAGKGHEVFQAAIRASAREAAGEAGRRRDLAKAPDGAWARPPYPARPGFRHELASALALMELLRRADPGHAALLGGCGEVIGALGITPDAVAEDERVDAAHPAARELAALPAEDVDLVAYLVCAHHGKVRAAWTSTPVDQDAEHGGIHGVRDGDEMGGFDVAAAGGEARLPALRLSLAAAAMGVNGRYGASWGERVAGLLDRWGPFALAYLEALLRAADARASMGEAG